VPGEIGRSSEPVLGEQVRQGRAPCVVVRVPSWCQRDVLVAAADAVDDFSENVHEFGACDEEAFLVGLAGGDVQERDFFFG
jgi:hypothetical protein